MKILLITIIAGSLLFIGVQTFALTSNSHSTSLTAADTEYWSVADPVGGELDFADNLTMSMWINFASTPAAAGLITKADTGSGDGSYIFLWAAASPDFFQFASYKDGTNKGCSDLNYNWINIVEDTWYHVALTKASGTVTVWVDGTDLSTETCLDATISDQGSAFVIGERLLASIPFDGLIDDVRVWSRTLSTSSIESLHSDPCNFNNGANLEGQWLFDNDGTDETANSNNLSETGGATFSTDAAYTCAAAVPPEEAPSILWFF